MTFGKGGTFKTQPACIPFPVFSSLLLLFWRSCLHPSGKRQPDRPSFFPYFGLVASPRCRGLFVPRGTAPPSHGSPQPAGAWPRLPLPGVGINWRCSSPRVPAGFKRSSRNQIHPDVPGARCSSARHVIRDKTHAWLQISSRGSISTPFMAAFAASK